MTRDAVFYMLCFVATWPATISVLRLAVETRGFTRGMCLGIGLFGIGIAGVVGFLMVQSLMT